MKKSNECDILKYNNLKLLFHINASLLNQDIECLNAMQWYKVWYYYYTTDFYNLSLLKG